jgi:copper(I)-binding protein
MEELMAQTGENGFHFVDEAAPPALMREVALEIIKRKLVVSWWTNIRFEKSFTSDLCILLKASGCIAVSGGLEVASDRLLELIKKGVTVEQVAQVTRNFTESGIMVHAYLMYGYPTQTVQETIDSLEMVRQLFELGILQSGFWHQFAMTAHSPVGMFPEEFGVIPEQNVITFANNDINFKDKTGINHDKFSFGLKKSLFNYMHGICFEYDLQDWFDFKIPNTKIPSDYIVSCLEKEVDFNIKPSAKIVWIGGKSISETFTRSTVAGQKNAGGFLTIQNEGNVDRLLSAKSNVSASMEIHEMKMDGNVMQMRQVNSLDIPSKGKVELKPGGYHLMFIDIKSPLKAGESVDVQLIFEKAGKVNVKLPIQDMKPMHGGSRDAGHGHK